MKLLTLILSANLAILSFAQDQIDPSNPGE